MEASGRGKRKVSLKYHSSDTEDSSEYSENETYSQQNNYSRKRNNSTEASSTSNKRFKIANGGRPSTSSDGDDTKIVKKRHYTTRKPECFNRGAIMARQNRLKKKQYVEDLEGQVSNLKNENKQLKRMLKSRSNLLRNLKHEKQYLKSVIDNRTEIGTLLKKFRGVINVDNENNVGPVLNIERQMPIARKTAYPFNDYVKQEQNISYNPEVIDPIMPNLDAMSPLLTETADFFTDGLNGLGFNFPTPESLSEDLFQHEFDILNMPDLLSPTSSADAELLSESSSVKPNHIQEHNYTSKKPKETAGVCFHIVDGKVSLEFCSKCHLSAKKNYLSSEHTESSEAEDESELEQ